MKNPIQKYLLQFVELVDGKRLNLEVYHLATLPSLHLNEIVKLPMSEPMFSRRIINIEHIFYNSEKAETDTHTMQMIVTLEREINS